MKHYDFLIVGTGLSGAVSAERIANKLEKTVLMVDKRDHIGGNCYDRKDENGVLIHQYGAHLFHTKYDDVFEYLSNFTKWHKYEHKVKTHIDGELYDIPVNMNSINKFFGKNFTNPKECEEFMETVREKIDNPQNAEEQVLSKVGRKMYEKFYMNYTLKQWEQHPRDLAAFVTARIPVRYTTDDGYFDDPYQYMPKEGFTKVFEKLLDHKNIEVKTNTNYKDIKDEISYDYLIYTGPIDEFYEHKLGKLPYRSLKFKFKPLDQEYFQDYAVVNYPNDHDYTRIVEIKHATGQQINKTNIMYEYPSAEGDPYYPVPLGNSAELYEKYKELANKETNVFFLGRLGQYRYINMDQTVKNALDFFNESLKPLYT